jgi:D-alanyl-D-alanine carboxypeptidase/D-alanyl-D-alanine-endopeptidase (penicillin-binding protein 4)
LAKQVKARGIARITGDVLIDGRLFPTSVGSGSGPRLVSPIIVNDNVIDVIVAPADAAGQIAHGTIRPESLALVLDNQVRTVAEGEPVQISVTGTAPGAVIVRGTIPLKSKPMLRILPVTDPAAMARALLIECLRKESIEVTASPFRAPTAELPPREGCRDLTVLATHTSLPLSEAIKVTLKVSQNLYASTLPLLVAVRHDERTLAQGLRRQGLYLRLLGVDARSFSFAGGAGGANADATTPRATVQLLTALMKRPEWSAIDAGLPILGVDGTLFGMVPTSSPVYGKVRAKTGTLWWDDLANERSILRSKALAGTLVTAKGKSLIFAMFVNDVPMPKGVLPSREGMLLGKICEAIHVHE